MIDWSIVEKYIAGKLAGARRRLDDFEGSDFQRGRLSGEVTTLAAMLNLPEALKVLELYDKEEANKGA